MRIATAFLLTLSFLTAASAVRAQAASQDLSEAIAPFLDPETIAVAHLSLNDARLPEALFSVPQTAPISEEDREKVTEVAMAMQAWLDQLREAGATHLFLVLSIADLPQVGAPFLLVTLNEQADPARVSSLLLGDNKNGQLGRGPFSVIEFFPGAVLAGERPSVERVTRQIRRDEKSPPPPHLATALEAVNESPARIVILPNEDHRRVVRELLPVLDLPIAGVSGQMIADGLVWAAIGLDPEKPAIHIVVQSEDDGAASRFAQTIERGLELAAEQLAPQLDELQQFVDRPMEIFSALKPVQEGDQLLWSFDDEKGQLSQVSRHFLPAFLAAHQASQRQERMNRFRQIAIAMHNYHDVNKTFPPQAIRGEDGRPLLSWRVALLPYLEGGELYRQFRLDEPWDSPHNMQLVERMPQVFADPDLPELAREGKTTYQVPAHEATIFPPQADGIPIKEILDGTSNTILFVEVVPERAVPWTKPEDWEVDPEKPLEGVARSDRETFTVAFADASAQSIANVIDPHVLWALLTRAGREPAPRR